MDQIWKEYRNNTMKSKTIQTFVIGLYFFSLEFTFLIVLLPCLNRCSILLNDMLTIIQPYRFISVLIRSHLQTCSQLGTYSYACVSAVFTGVTYYKHPEKCLKNGSFFM
uniref:Uncharacterized protein n=1 Tax=Pyxicephalus adspersus TaxID=30357 RepID=A0AAV3AN27_PYXAD|nr:TPA: hypothetical protein GDO54_010195 [Pyxicephalus adspersus]